MGVKGKHLFVAIACLFGLTGCVIQLPAPASEDSAAVEVEEVEWTQQDQTCEDIIRPLELLNSIPLPPPESMFTYLGEVSGTVAADPELKYLVDPISEYAFQLENEMTYSDEGSADRLTERHDTMMREISTACGWPW